MRFLFVDILFMQTIGHVVFDIEGVEQGAFLEDHADIATQLQQLVFGQRFGIHPKQPDGAAVRA